jgi:hypothetical protein
MIDQVDLDEALNDIIELEILEVVVCRDVQLLHEVVLQVELTPEVIIPAKWPPQFQHEVSEVSKFDKAGTL